MGKILFLTTLLPYPLDNGGKIKSYNTIKALSEDYQIDLVCFVNKTEEKENVEKLKNIADDIKIVQKTLIRSTSLKSFAIDYIKSLLTTYPYSINKFYVKEMEDILAEKISNNEYDYIYIDHLPMMVYMQLFKNHNVILDQHNVENMIFKRYLESEKSFAKKLIGYMEYKKLERFERKAMQKADQIVCLSEEDKHSFENLGIHNEILNVIPIHMDIKKEYNYSPHQPGKLKILFLGSMSWYPNQSGIQWFMENVWDKLDDKDYELYIVGSNPTEDIKKYDNNSNVYVTGYVNDVDEYITKCDISIVPLFVGSGQRVKIIESFAKKIPVLSTSIGAEGLTYQNGKDIILADSAEEFINNLEKIKENNSKLLSISEHANNNFKENYSANVLPAKLKKVIEKCKG
ncbi:glycosyltransferase [Bacillus cereus]|uniref:glycosyltransferase n=2 Tax=Bacillus cereus TaxID=1396 RepID=UPI0020C00F3F|nr:glycosyltransferase [Bacillus cereus]MDF9475231.1 glycosyltransferase [Bacillus cereus]MDF9497262.1 glycosyltransferase [Bacillus cereus]MDF9565462.1 glycosyltransferase [Bacillus cereus]